MLRATRAMRSLTLHIAAESPASRARACSPSRAVRMGGGGFAMGVERVLALMVECGNEIPRSVPDVYLIHQGEAANGAAWKTVRHLRDNGLKAILHCGDGSFKAQMKKADASGARFAVIIGDDEAQAGEISIKPLREAAEQVRVGLTEAVDLLKRT